MPTDNDAKTCGTCGHAKRPQGLLRCTFWLNKKDTCDGQYQPCIAEQLPACPHYKEKDTRDEENI